MGVSEREKERVSEQGKCVLEVITNVCVHARACVRACCVNL